MATGPMRGVLGHLRRATLLRDAADRTDGQLLESFLARREEAAFEALVRRHGPMVLGVCRRVLHNGHDAEDAFQATFLVLVRKAHAIRPRELVGNWLHGVAYRTALRARSAAALRRAKERQARDMARPQPLPDDSWRDVQPLLDQGLNGLPEKYRVAIVLCDLEGKTRKEAARQLGWPEGTLSCRLARGRALLAQRLTQRGLTASGAALALSLAQGAAAAVPTALLASTTQAALTGAAAAVPAHVAALATGVLKAMLLTKLKVGAAVVVAMGVLVAGAGALNPTTSVAPSAAVQVDAAAPSEREKTQEVPGPDRKDVKRPADEARRKAERELYLRTIARAQQELESVGREFARTTAVERAVKAFNDALRRLKQQTPDEQTELEALREIEKAVKGLQDDIHRRKAQRTALAKLQGLWQIKKIEVNGPLPVELVPWPLPKPSTVGVFGDRFLVKGGGDLEKVPIIRLDPKRAPTAIDFDLGGKLFLAVYDLQGDVLRICFGDGRVRPVECTAGSGRVLVTYQRKQP